MPRSKRDIHALAVSTETPPESLPASQAVARVVHAAGNNLYRVEYADGGAALVELESKFRSTIWIKRGSFVVVDASTLADRENKIAGEIVNVVRDEKRWRKMSYWPVEFSKQRRPLDGDPSDDDRDHDGPQMPPSSDEEDDG